MPGIAEIALGAAPIAGGALLGVAAGNLKARIFAVRSSRTSTCWTGYRRKTRSAGPICSAASTSASTVSSPPVTAADALREAAVSYQGNWRDIVLFV